MKIAIITDQHFGARKGNQNLHDYFKKFYETVFFPTLEKEGIDTVIDMGDTFDTRKGIDFGLSIELKRFTMIAFSLWASLCIQLSEITQSFITKTLTRLTLLTYCYESMITLLFMEVLPKLSKLGLKTFFIPWINDENHEDTMAIMKRTKAKVAFGHLEMRGFYANKTYICEHGEDKANYSKFEKVFSSIIITETFKIMSTILGTHMKSIGMM